MITIKGLCGNQEVTILKDDGCNTNVISLHFAKRNRKVLDIRKAKSTITHSNKSTEEESNFIVKGAIVQMGSHSYCSNWVIADIRYDIILGIPWHESQKPKIDYEPQEVRVDGKLLPVHNHGRSPEIIVSNLGVKKFRKLLRKRKKDGKVEIYQALMNEENCHSQVTVVQNIEKIIENSAKEERMEHIIRKYESVFTEDLPSGLPPIREVDHNIEIPEGQRIPNRPIFQLSPAELLATREYIIKLLRTGKIRRSKSPYGAPLFFVKEKDKLRGVVDYRALNRITKRNNTPIPRTDEMFDQLGKAKYFSKLDLKTVFHQIRIKEEDVEKTAFNTKYGHYDSLVMPMGLCNAPATFQTLMDTIFFDCIDRCMVVYMDDLLIFSETKESHFEHLELVLQRLKQNQLYIGSKKCTFMEHKTEFLGLELGQDGIGIGSERIRVVQQWPKPKTLSELRGFIGLLQYFRRFIKNFSRMAWPLTDLTRKGKGIQAWNNSCEEAFSELKNCLCFAPILVCPNWEKSFKCHVDASQKAVGGTLSQADDFGRERVISYFSKRLSQEEENYSANDRELLGLVYFLKRFRCYLEGTSFEVITDNQILKSYFTKQKLSRKETRWLEFLSQFGISDLTLKKRENSCTR